LWKGNIYLSLIYGLLLREYNFGFKSEIDSSPSEML